jgi:hypothetical protein
MCPSGKRKANCIGILLRKLVGKRFVGRPRRRQRNNIEVDLK